MLRQEWSEKLGKWLIIPIWVCAVLVSFISALLKADPNQFQSPLAQSSIRYLHNSAWWIILVLTVAGAVAQLIRSYLGPSVVWHTVQYLLDQYREEMFGKGGSSSDDPQYFHRITLFKHVSWHWGVVRWPWSGWMIPVARSGYLTRSRIAKFRASENDPGNAEGVAGQAWAQGRPVQVYGLPDINSDSASENALADYASQGYVSRKWLERRRKKRKSHALSLLGIPVEVKGRPWGVLVVDSQSPNEIISEKALKGQRYKTLGRFLSRLLEKA
ncbi:MAG TPA: GAF domain-containing protein [Blastocatellia bacterium]|nr:GAF domain-containing protein [Blastocatellia bacterium]